MGFIKKYYTKLRKHRQNEIKRISRLENNQLYFLNKSLTSSDQLLNNTDRNEKIIVTLTTHDLRINSVFMAIESIARQTMKPDTIVLWISEETSYLPVSLQRLVERGLTIKYCKDIGPHTKLVYSLKEYPRDIIISIDDDILYPHDFIENLYRAHSENPGIICCNVAMRILKDNKGKIMPYTKWEKVYAEKCISLDLFPLGVDGILYIPGCLDNEAFNMEKLKSLCPKADDIWFKAMSLKNNVKVLVTGNYPDFINSFLPLDSSFINALVVDNVFKNENDSQLEAVFNYYSLDI